MQRLPESVVNFLFKVDPEYQVKKALKKGVLSLTQRNWLFSVVGDLPRDKADKELEDILYGIIKEYKHQLWPWLETAPRGGILKRIEDFRTEIKNKRHLDHTNYKNPDKILVEDRKGEYLFSELIYFITATSIEKNQHYIFHSWMKSTVHAITEMGINLQDLLQHEDAWTMGAAHSSSLAEILCINIFRRRGTAIGTTGRDLLSLCLQFFKGINQGTGDRYVGIHTGVKLIMQSQVGLDRKLSKDISSVMTTKGPKMKVMLKEILERLDKQIARLEENKVEGADRFDRVREIIGVIAEQEVEPTEDEMREATSLLSQVSLTDHVSVTGAAIARKLIASASIPQKSLNPLFNKLDQDRKVDSIFDEEGVIKTGAYLKPQGRIEKLRSAVLNLVSDDPHD